MEYEFVRLWNNLDQAYGMGNIALCLFGTLFILWAVKKADTKSYKNDMTRPSKKINAYAFVRFCASFCIGLFAAYFVIMQFEKNFGVYLLQGFTEIFGNIMRIA